MIVSTFVMATVARRTDIGATRIVEPQAIRTIDLTFADLPDGSIRVADVSGAKPPVILQPGEDGFVRVALRALALERRVHGASPEIPFRLGQQADGTLFLRDLATNRLLALSAYGHGNAKSFAQFIGPGRTYQ